MDLSTLLIKLRYRQAETHFRSPFDPKFRVFQAMIRLHPWGYRRNLLIRTHLRSSIRLLCNWTKTDSGLYPRTIISTSDFQKLMGT